MSSASNNYGRWQFKIDKILIQNKEAGEATAECSINTLQV